MLNVIVFSFPASRIRVHLIGAAYQIIHTDIVKIGKPAEHLHGNFPDAVFIIAGCMPGCDTNCVKIPLCI